MDAAAQDLEAALAATAAALDAGDGEAAAEASARAARACATLEAGGHRLEPERLARLAELQARCQATAAQALGRLGGELAGAARSTRAAAAYKR
jgi:hypothetical protein